MTSLHPSACFLGQSYGLWLVYLAANSSGGKFPGTPHILEKNGVFFGAIHGLHSFTSSAALAPCWGCLCFILASHRNMQLASTRLLRHNSWSCPVFTWYLSIILLYVLASYMDYEYPYIVTAWGNVKMLGIASLVAGNIWTSGLSLLLQSHTPVKFRLRECNSSINIQ